MKTDRIRRAGVLALAVAGVLAASWVLPPAVHRARRLCPVRQDGVSEAGAYATFARRYGVDCSVCHVSYPQLNETGYKFRTSGYRMPDEIGNEAKWSNWGDNASIKMKVNYTAITANPGSTPSTETNGFANTTNGLEVFPIEGAFGKYVAANSEVDFVNGPGGVAAVTMNNANLDATFPITADSFVTMRVGLMSAFQGYGASDRLVGALSPTFLPTPSQIQPGAGGVSVAYNKFAAGGDGLELAYNWKGTHVSAQVTNGYNSKTASTQLGEDNHYKDFSFFVNQMLFNESAIAAHFYSGTAGYAFSGPEAASTPYSAQWYDNYMRGVVYATIKALPGDKLDLLAGFADGTDHVYDLNTKSSSDQFHSMGWFAQVYTVQHVLSQQLTTALAYGTNRKSTSTAGNRVSDVTLSFAVPIQNNKFDISFQARRAQNGVNTPDTTTNTAQAQWEFMF
jgi:hypothetical protein